jgi:mannose-6-phosphate isomerase class I
MAEKKGVVIPAVDLGATKIAMAFIRAEKRRTIAKLYPPAAVVREKGFTDAVQTLKRVARLIKTRTREMENQGWIVVKRVGMGAPGLYREDGSVNPKSVPNIPGLAQIRPALFLQEILGKDWKVFIENDGAVQALAAAHLFVHSSDYSRNWKKIIDETGGKMIYLGPGTGFGAGKINIDSNKRVAPLPGSQAFFDVLIRDGKTAEDLIGGAGIGRIAQKMEQERLLTQAPALLKFTEGYDPWQKNPRRRVEKQIARISAKVLANAWESKDPAAHALAEQIFVVAGRDLARLVIGLHQGQGKKSLLSWDKFDWESVKGTRIFLVSGLLTGPEGKQLTLPAARKVLKQAGYAEAINLVELDQHTALKNIKIKIGVIGASLVVPEKELMEARWGLCLTSGRKQIFRRLIKIIKQSAEENKRPILVCMDGYSGVDWKKSVIQLQEQLAKDGVSATAIDFSGCYKSADEIADLISSYETGDKTFGRMYPGKIEDLLDEKVVYRLRESLEKYRSTRLPGVVVCYGPGAACKALASCYDLIIYMDLTREEVNRRAHKGLLTPLGQKGKDEARKGQPAYLAGKRFYYIDFPILDRHRKSIRKKIHFYVDDTLSETPKMICREVFDEMISDAASGPIQLKSFHDEGIWGGQWLKKVRHLPKTMINCAWAYELMAYHMSVRLPIGDAFIETPFANLLDREPGRIMGQRIRRRFSGLWPIRVNYDDCWEGDDMAVQIHPDAAYIKKNFKEPLHQDESYYIVDATPDAYVHVGLKGGIDLARFFEAVQKAEAQRIPFDHREFVNVFPARPGDLFLLPAGTVHASGKGCVVLELSCTTDRYTFHLYDYLRPDLNGKLRDIHLRHAIAMVNKYPGRTTAWVKKHLIQKPKLIRKGKDWTEHLIGKLDGYIPEIHRFEIASAVKDNTKGIFHILSLVRGSGITVAPERFPEKRFDLNFSETVIIPACLGPYSIVNSGGAPAVVLKTVVNDSFNYFTHHAKC